jgi:outer membrane protein OmpA-like peptidoglycan-associated protein
MVQKSDKPSFTLPDALFDVDQSEIRKTEIASFTEKILDLIKMNAPLKITIEGHTDNSGTNDYNLKLSLRRAETVKRIIVASGYPEKNIIINGLGSSRPIGSNDTPEGRQRNRRVEVYF